MVASTGALTECCGIRYVRERNLVSEIFAPNLWLPVVHILRSFVFFPSAHKNVTSSQQQKFSTMTRSSSRAAARAAADTPFPKPSARRIGKESTCIMLGITKASIKCTGCTNVEEKLLVTKVKSSSIVSRLNKCRQPWVLKRRTGQSIQVYENTWKELVEELGYPKPRLHDHSGNFAAHPKKKQKLTMPPAHDVDAYNLSCSPPTCAGSPTVASSLSRPPPMKEITTTCALGTDTPSTLSPLSDLGTLEGTSSHKEQEGHLMLNILEQNKRLQDIVVAQNILLSSKTQNSQLASEATNERLFDLVAGLSSENILLRSQIQNSQLASEATASEPPLVLMECKYFTHQSTTIGK
jgi:hypothetical protein